MSGSVNNNAASHAVPGHAENVSNGASTESPTISGQAQAVEAHAQRAQRKASKGPTSENALKDVRCAERMVGDSILAIEESAAHFSRQVMPQPSESN
jgi:hypothetical protein